MINNDILRRIVAIFALTDEQVCTVSSLGGGNLSIAQLNALFLEKNEADYVALLDLELASFLNGLIIDKRGPSDSPQRPAESELSNNMIFNKLKIALAFKADDVISILSSAGIELGKYELSAFFRNVNHKHYKNCSDEVLSAFLKGLKLKAD